MGAASRLARWPAQRRMRAATVARVLPRDRAVVLALAAGAVLRILLALLTPMLFAPDESSHALYVVDASQGHLPVNSANWLWATRNGADEFFQPPAYYLLAGALFRVMSPLGGVTALYGVRLLNVALGLAVVVLTWHIGRRIAPAQPRVARWAAVAVAFLPTFVATSASITNDVLCIALVALGTLLVLRHIDRGGIGLRHGIALAVVVGAALLTKTSSIVLLPTIAAGVAVVARRRTADALVMGGAGLLGVVLTLPWWIGRNLAAYGNLLAVGDAYPHWQAPLAQRIADTARNGGETFIAAFGRQNEVRPGAMLSLIVAAVVVVLGAIGVARIVRPGAHGRGGVTVLLVQIIATAVLAISFALSADQPQGRYLFYALPAIAVVVMLGANAVAGTLASRWRAVTRPMATRMVGLAAFVLPCATVASALVTFTDVQVVHAVGGPDYSALMVTRDPVTWVLDRSQSLTR